MRGIYRYTFLFLLLISATHPVFAQQAKPERGSIAFFDSLDIRITDLQRQVSRLKQIRDVAYYNLQRELEQTLFIKSTEEYVRDEDLDQAKKLIESRLEKAELRKDQLSVQFCRNYKDDVNRLIKYQRMHYQSLFAKEKNFKRAFDKLVETGLTDNYQKASRMVNLALKYARENNLATTIQYLENYRAYTDALVFDLHSSYDLALITQSTKEFEKVFLPLVESDTIENIREAETLIKNCINYSRLTGSKLDPTFFQRQALVVSTSMSDLLETKGREKELEKYTDEAVKARMDSLNPCGVFKWHDQIVVIDEFNPTASMENVKKGEAIIHADQMLAAYLKKNKLCGSIKDLSFGYSFVIPYRSDNKNSAFYYNPNSQKWQYIACYTTIIDPGYTQRVSKYMPPLQFLDEKVMAVN